MSRIPQKQLRVPFATTGSNSFTGSQYISGSVYIDGLMNYIQFANGGKVGDIQNISYNAPDPSGSIDLYAPNGAAWVQMNYDNRNFVYLEDRYVGASLSSASYSPGFELGLDYFRITLTSESVTKQWTFNLSGLTVFPDFTFPTGSGVVGSILVNDGSGNLYWGTGSISSSYALSASYSLYASSSSYSTSSSYALSASYSISSSKSVSASYATNANYSNYAGLAITQNSNQNQDYSIVFAPSGTNGYLQTYTDSNSKLLYNPSSSKLTVPIISASIGITGSLFGTASQAVTASYVLNAVSSSYSSTASYVLNAVSSSYASNSLSASYSVTSSYSQNATSSSYATTASYSDYAVTASISNATLQTDIIVLNQSGNNIAKGVVVRITGSNNSSDIPRIVTASYLNDNNSANTLGITTEAISNGSQGVVITEGVLLGVNTSNFIPGQLVYLGATGSIIGYAPLAPLHAVRLGEVVRQQSNNGSIYVRIDNGYEIDELHNVLINTSSLSYGDLLMYSSSVWTNSKILSGSYILSGSLTTNDGISIQTLTASIVSASSITGSLFGTASYAITSSYILNAVSSSYASSSLSASYSISSSQAQNANTASYAVVSAYPVTTTGSSLYSTIPLTGNVSSNNSIYLGGNAGGGALASNFSVFLGYYTGQLATSASEAVFIGPLTGLEASKANGSIFLGSGAGKKAVSASYSTLIGYYPGSTDDPLLSIGNNNIILGNSITLPSKAKDSINIGAIIFATGSYSNLGTLYSGSQYNIGRVGINKVTPEYTLDVSGSGNYSNGLTVTGSLIATSFTGSLQGTASWASNAINAQTASFLPIGTYQITSSWAVSASQAITASYITGAIYNSTNPALSASYALTASYVANASSFPYTGSAIISGSLIVTGSLTTTGGVNIQILTASIVSASSFTGSLFGTATTASYVQTAQSASYVLNSVSSSYAATASYAANGGVTQIVAGTNVTISPTNGIGIVTINSSGGGSGGAGANVTASFTNLSTWTFNHSLANQGVIIQTYDTSWNQIIPQSIVLTNSNTATITFPSNESGYAIASLGGVTTTAASASFASTASYVNTLNQNVIITGSVAIGTGSVGSGENNLLLGPAPAGGVGEGGQLGLLAPGGTYTSSSFLDNYQNQFRILSGPGATSNAGVLAIDLGTRNATFQGSVTASGFNGLPNDYLYVTRNTNQTIGSGNWANQDIVFNNSVVSKGITYNTGTGLASLTAGKVYRITARLAWSAAATYLFEFSCYNSSNSQLGPSVQMVQSTNGSFNISDGTLDFIYAPGSNVDIKIRTTNNTTALSGEYVRGDLNTQLIIQQIA